MSKGILIKRPLLIPSLIASIFSLLTLPDWPYNYFLPDHRRFVIFCFALYISSKAYRWGKMLEAWLFGFIAAFWLIIWLIEDTRERWQLIPLIICSMLFAIIAFIFKRPSEEKNISDAQREGFGIRAITGLLAVVFFTISISYFIEAKNNQKGGNIPIYAGHGESRDEVDEKCVNSAEYKRYKLGEGIFSLVIGVACGSFYIYSIVKKESEENELENGRL